MTAFVLLANGFEDIEAVAPIDILRRGGVDVKTVSITESTDDLTGEKHGEGVAKCSKCP